MSAGSDIDFSKVRYDIICICICIWSFEKNPSVLAGTWFFFRILHIFARSFTMLSCYNQNRKSSDRNGSLLYLHLYHIADKRANFLNQIFDNFLNDEILRIVFHEFDSRSSWEREQHNSKLQKVDPYTQVAQQTRYY